MSHSFPFPPDRPALSTLIERHLACPRTHLAVTVRDGLINAAGESFQGRIERDVAVMLQNVPVSYFDEKFAVMQRGHEERGGEWIFAYAKQISLLEGRLALGGTVLDVGCGPALPYTKPNNAFVIGLEYSLPSVAANQQVDLRVCASASSLPLADDSVDTIVCLYSIHHMTGHSVAETKDLVSNVLSEFTRVIKPGGEVLIIEMAPIAPFGLFEGLFWNLAKKLMGKALDMFFWPVAALSARIDAAAPLGKLSIVRFDSSPWTSFPPIFSIPWMRIPRFLYPLRSLAYSWQPKPSARSQGSTPPNESRA
jgi:SAM-dependent methyltransferase